MQRVGPTRAHRFVLRCIEKIPGDVSALRIRLQNYVELSPVGSAPERDQVRRVGLEILRQVGQIDRFADFYRYLLRNSGLRPGRVDEQCLLALVQAVAEVEKMLTLLRDLRGKYDLAYQADRLLQEALRYIPRDPRS